MKYNKQLLLWALLFVMVLIVLSLTSCKTRTIIQTIPEYHQTITHDTLTTHDTLRTEHTTIIRELDSLQMSQYGIRLADQQRAWLIERQSLQQQISTLQRVHTDTIRDTIPVPYPVTVSQKATTHKYPLIIAIFAILLISYLVLKRLNNK